MNYEEFKEQMVDAVKQELENRGIEAKVDTQTVEKMNEKYESITITPEGSNIGVNVNLDQFYKAYDSKQDEKEKSEKKKSVKKQISDKKEKAAKTAKPKKVDTKNLGEAI